MNLQFESGEVAECHPQAVVSAMIQAHTQAFAQLNGFLDLAVQDAYARLEDRHEPGPYPGAVLCPLVRDALLAVAKRKLLAAEGLTLTEGSNKSARLSDLQGNQMRIRKHPLAFKESSLLEVMPPLANLFGFKHATRAYDLFVLWVPDERSLSLASASLAAVANMDDGPKAVIYAAVRLPDAPALATDTTAATERTQETGDEWGDEFGSQKRGADTSV